MVMRIAAMHDQVVRAAVTDVGVAMQIIHGHAGVLEARLAEGDDGLGGRPRPGVIHEHDVGEAQQSVMLRRLQRRRERG